MSLRSVDVARAAYLWRLHLERPSSTDQVAELRAAHELLLSLHAGEATAELAVTRAAYVTAIQVALADLDREVADLAALQAQLIVDEQERAAALDSHAAVIRGLESTDPHHTSRSGI